MTEDDTAYKIAAELPGLEEKDVEVSVTGDMLTLKGENRQEKEEKNKNWYLTERAYGAFERAFAIRCSALCRSPPKRAQSNPNRPTNQVFMRCVRMA